MKRPITVLCISDLHLQEIQDKTAGDNIYVEPLERLSQSLMHFQDESPEKIVWNPDFLLIAGDLVNRCTQSDYNYVERQINRLISLFNIEPFRVIMTPGNHDRQITTPRTKCRMNVVKQRYNKTEERFENICRTESLSDDLKLQFVKDHVDSFRQFTDMYKHYTQPARESEKFLCWPDLFNGLPTPMQDLQYTSGLKVFEDEKICFLSVNTEWLYTRSSIKPAHEQKMRLCTPLIGWAFNEIRQAYPDYTIVSVMHRDPRSLSWKARNVSDPAQIDSISLLEVYSDIILSGHDHTLKINPPTMLQNRAQHCGIGSVSRPAGINENVRYTATLLHINPIKREMRLLAYDRWDDRKPWQFVDLGVFPLQSKYQPLSLSKNIDDNKSIVKIRAKSSNDSDIEKAIKCYLRWDKNKHSRSRLLLMHYNTLKDSVELAENRICEACKNYDRIFFYRWQMASRLQTSNKTESDNTPLQKLRKRFRNELLNTKLIIMDILVEVPTIILPNE